MYELAWTHDPLDGGPFRGHVVAPTQDDVRLTCFEGVTGLLSVIPSECVKKWNRAELILELTNGAWFRGFSAEKSARLRGPQCHVLWLEEFAAWPRAQEVLDMAIMGHRLGRLPRLIVTSTPRPTPEIKALIADPTVHLARGKTTDNAANLPRAFLDKLRRRYEGTRLGRQELDGEVLEDTAGALWRLAVIDGRRVMRIPPGVGMVRLLVAVDPAVTATEDSDETGIVVGGLGTDGVAYVLHDLSGTHPIIAEVGGDPDWGQVAVKAYRDLAADGIVAEVNNGGDLVVKQVKAVDPNANVIVVHSSRGKELRASPVAACYVQGRVRHVGAFPGLEDQMTTWVPGLGKSPDRVDALVFLITALLLENDQWVEPEPVEPLSFPA
jgi:phage terminase large subunit-like protein